jgi:sterol desaturase/sphingolipid hydroxylase (fatty acid hydroxylase superfamily)
VIATPIGAILFAVATHNVAWLFVTTAMSYFLTYEWLHFAYHLDEGSTLGRLPIFRALRRHHQTHHDKAKMGRFNFNITFPIADVIFRTNHRRIKVSEGSKGASLYKSNGDATEEEAASPGNHRSA